MTFTLSTDAFGITTCVLTYPPSAGASYSYPYSIFQDTSSALVLGSSTGSFVGFLYSFTVYSEVQTVSGLSVTICTSSATNCLFDCDFGTYFNEGTCQNCLNICTKNCPASCPNGCRRGTDCGLNTDSICGSYSSYSSCTSCLANSNFNGGVCKCFSNYY